MFLIHIDSYLDKLYQVLLVILKHIYSYLHFDFVDINHVFSNISLTYRFLLLISLNCGFSFPS